MISVLRRKTLVVTCLVDMPWPFFPGETRGPSQPKLAFRPLPESRDTKDALSDSTLFFLHFREKHVLIFRPNSKYFSQNFIIYFTWIIYHTIASLLLISTWLLTCDLSAGLHILQLSSSHCLLGSELSWSFPLTVRAAGKNHKIILSYLANAVNIK